MGTRHLHPPAIEFFVVPFNTTKTDYSILWVVLFISNCSFDKLIVGFRLMPFGRYVLNSTSRLIEN